MLSTRILTALILVPAVLAALFLLPPAGWGAVTLVAFCAAAVEWSNLVGYARRARLLFVAGTFVIGCNLLFSPSLGFERGWPTGVVLAVCGPATLFWLLVAPPWLRVNWRPASKLGMAVLGWIVLSGAWVAIVQLQAQSSWLVFAAFAIVWIADTAAYFTGRAVGRHKLAPAISPGKTREGLYGALVAVAAYALILVPFARDAGYTGEISISAVVTWVSVAIALALLSVGGDLFESLLKRHAGVKDSGTLLPGHGGILDRIDALLAAMPPAALLALMLLR
jgi:phosphatidate cytidylyltransferase